ncbi:pectate lyase [Ramlibacter pallidus]|uniref:Pectate lyase n=1 Tax=Ramlibacter pallidus TaxID=2780087 RepID=A0ABR9S741_9BURK|nr:pectate lyase [Ramlibacter pallidus]MBE7369303.1 pectate lyase [Ramlibacter pallidus]
MLLRNLGLGMLAGALLVAGCGGGDGGTPFPVAAPQPEESSRPCTAETDSNPSSLGADGWAAAGGAVTGGCGALAKNTFTVTNRRELVQALYAGKPRTTRADDSWEAPDDTPKIIYVRGTIDLNVDDDLQPLTEEAYMARCNYTGHATYYDPVTRNESGNGGFFGAYKAAYDPNVWNRQGAVPRASDGRLAPPPVSGPLEEARACFQKAQERVAVVRVGSNTSIIGLGTDARIVRGNLRLGWLRADPADPQRQDAANYKATNVVIRNIAFEDSYDMFPGWDPQDSFSISGRTNSMPYLADCQAVYDAGTDKGPHKCRGGRWNSEYDTVSVENAEQVWIDGNSFSDGARPDRLSPGVWTTTTTFEGRPYQIFNEATQKVQHHDGLVDVTLGGTRVTVSRNHFFSHDKGHLLGGSDFTDPLLGYGPGRIDVTFHHNHWQNVVQRMPRVRFGRVHVYNNYYEGTRAAGGNDYLYSEAWTLGTAAKIVTENNLFDIGGTMDASRLVGFSSTLANGAGTAQAPGRCVQAGYSTAECGTWYFDTGTVLNGVLVDVYAAAQVKASSSASNAPLQRLDPADPASFWHPQRTYTYTALPTATGADQAALRDAVRAQAGAGKL